MKKIPVLIYRRVEKYLNEEVSDKDRAKIFAGIRMMQVGDYSAVFIKTLRGPIRELIEKFHRLLFFAYDSKIHFVSGFRKKSAKTPKKELEFAEQVYKQVKKP